MKAVHECGLRIPTDIAIMGFDNLIFSEICLVPLTTVNQNLFALGTTSMEVLLNKVQGKENAPYPIMPEPYIVERQSV
jgi:alanine racemase